VAILKNVTQDTVILSNLEVATTFLSRLKGLLGRNSLDASSGLLINPCNSVHCFFMKFPIDVAFVDKDNQVCHIITGMKPGKISPIVRRAKYVIEGNANAFTGKLKAGDIVKII
jgi:hypothetical protein